MIVRDATGLRATLRMILVRNWLIVLVVLGIEVGSLELHRVLPSLQTSAFSEAGVAVLAGAVGVFLSFRFNEAYGRWWEARILWGGLVNASRTFARQVVTYIGGESADRDALRRELVRGQIAFVNAMRCSLRREDVESAAAPFLSEGALRELAGSKSWPTQIVKRQNRLVKAALGDDAGGQLVLSRFDATLAEITSLQGGMERIKNTAFPDGVILTSRLLVWAVAILVCLAFVDPLDVVYVLEFVAILMIVLSFRLVVQLGEDLNDPFENRPNDTPMTALCRTIEIDLLQMLGETDLPDPIEPVGGVLM
jgi:putative membrane protein